MESKQNVQDAA